MKCPGGSHRKKVTNYGDKSFYHEKMMLGFGNIVETGIHIWDIICDFCCRHPRGWRGLKSDMDSEGKNDYCVATHEGGVD